MAAHAHLCSQNVKLKRRAEQLHTHLSHCSAESHNTASVQKCMPAILFIE